MTNEAKKHLDQFTELSSHDDALRLLDHAGIVMEQAREYKRQADELLIDWIRANGDMTRNQDRWYVGTPKVVKCVDAEGVAKAMLETASMDDLLRCLTTQPWKAAAVKDALGEQAFDRLFSVTYPETLKGGKVRKGQAK